MINFTFKFYSTFFLTICIFVIAKASEKIEALALIDTGSKILYLGTEGDLYLKASNSSVTKSYVNDTYGRIFAFERKENTLIAVGENGKILRSTSQGSSWALCDTPFLLGDLTSVSPSTDDSWLAVGSDGASAVALVSRDDGLTWDFLPNSESRSRQIPRNIVEKKCYYFDSLYGDDSKDGTTPSSAKRTLSSVENIGSNAIVYLARGSEWREQLVAGNYVEIRAYGTGEKPIINAADIVGNNQFQAVETFSNIYSVTWRLSVSNNLRLVDVVQALEDGKPLKWANSLSECNRIPGSFYETLGASEYERVVYVHPMGSSDIRTNQKNYEIAKRPHSLSLGDYCSVFDVATQNNAHNDGSFKSGTFLYGARLDLRHGTKHIALLGGDCFVKDSVIHYSNNKNLTNNSGQIVVYREILEEHEIIFKRCQFSQDANISRNAYAFLSHGHVGSKGYNKVVVFDECNFSEFKLIHGSLGLPDSNDPLGGAWFIGCEFENCNRIWNSSGYSNWNGYYLKCHFLNDSSIGRSYFFEGARDNRTPRGGLYLFENWFQVLNTTILMGTFDSLHLEWNTFNGVNSISASYLSAFDFIDGDGGSGERLTFKNNLIAGYTKPLRYKTNDFFSGFDALEWDRNIYLNYNSAGLYELNFQNKTFIDWQASTGLDALSYARELQLGDLTWDTDLQRPKFLGAAFPVGPGERSIVEAPLEIEVGGFLTSFSSVDWHPSASKWVAVGETCFGLGGGGKFISETRTESNIEIEVTVPELSKVVVDASGGVYALGLDQTIAYAEGYIKSFQLISYLYNSNDDFGHALGYESGSVQAFASNGVFNYLLNGVSRFDGQINISDGSLLAAGVIDGNVTVLTSNGNDLETLLNPLQVRSSIELQSLSQYKIGLHGATRGRLYWLEHSAELNDSNSWQKVDGSEFRPSGDLHTWTIEAGSSTQEFWRIVNE